MSASSHQNAPETGAQQTGAPEAAGADDDTILPFAVVGLDARGRIARLGQMVDEIVTRHAYPEPVAEVVAEALALAALLGSSLKMKGRFVIQTQTDGPISFLIADYEVPGRMRAYCRFDEARVGEAATGASLLGNGHLAFTIDQGTDMRQYQGIVPLENTSLEDAALAYFAQSEQIPTALHLSAGQVIADGRTRWRAGGILLQHLPAEGGAPIVGSQDEDFSDGLSGDAWTEARTLLSTVEHHEVLDPALSGGDLLFRLFHERGVRVLEPQEIEGHCRCSRARITAMLDQFTEEEIRDMTVDAEITVTCEFCNTVYAFDPNEYLPQADSA